jgi:ribosomal protein S5
MSAPGFGGVHGAGGIVQRVLEVSGVADVLTSQDGELGA